MATDPIPLDERGIQRVYLFRFRKRSDLFLLRYILHRLLSSLVVLLAIVTITFLLMHAIPGGPFTGEKNLSPILKSGIVSTTPYGSNTGITSSI